MANYLFRCFCVLVFLFLNNSLFALDPSIPLNQFRHDIWTTENGLPSNSIQTITQTRDGYIWVGTTAGLVRFDGTKFKIFGIDDLKTINADVLALLEDRSGTLWIGTNGAGLVRYKNGVFSQFTTKDGLFNNFVWALHEDQQRNILIGTEKGVNVYRRNQFEQNEVTRKLAGRYIFGINEDSTGALWFSTNRDGLFRLKDGEFKNFNSQNGLPHDIVYSVMDDSEKNIWIATYAGLTRLNDGIFTNFTTKDGLSSDTAYGVKEDRHKNLWITTELGGLVKYRNKFEAFYQREGFKNSTWFAYEDREGNLWVSSYTMGLDKYTDEKNAIDLAPPVVIENVFVDDKLLGGDQPVEIEKGRLEVQFAALSFVAPEKLRFRYKLEGVDKDWKEAGANRIARYENLTPGNYHFLVIAANHNGVWNHTGASTRFRLFRPFSSSYTFYILCVVLFAAAGTGLHYFRTHSLRKKQLELQRTVNDRTIELQREVNVRREAELNLEYSLSVLVATLESTADGILVIKTDGKMARYNSKFIGLWQIPEGIIQSGDEESIIGFLVEQIKEDDNFIGLLRSTSFNLEDDRLGVLELVDDRIFSWYLQHYRLGENIAGRVWSFSDITEQERTKAALRNARDAAESANRAKTQFLANVSHELRTPMNGIMGMTHLALETNLSEEQREYLQMVSSSADILLELLNEILDLSKIETGKFKLSHQSFNLQEVVSNAIDAIEIRARQKGLQIIVDISSVVPPHLNGDPVRLRQILLNLIGNAIKFTHKGSIEIDIALNHQTQDSAELHFTVKDTGIGIPLDKQQTIFEPFVQADDSTTRQYGGSGLGLAICSDLVHMMNGRIWVVSEPGKGSEFHFTASFGICSLIDNPIVAAPEGSSSFCGFKVLLVEDNEVNQRVAQRILEKQDMVVTLAENGKVAVDLAKSNDFDLILMDIQMPELDGLSATREIRGLQEQSGKHTPIVGMTAHAVEGFRNRCLQAGMDNYIAKPFRAKEFLKVAAKLLLTT